MEKLTLQEQAQEILAKAREKGVQSNFFFVTTFKRYQVQMQILNSLEKEINELGATVQKEYVKGRKNVYTNPAISEYNKTATAANGTVSTLMKIITDLPKEESNESLNDIMAKLLSDEFIKKFENKFRKSTIFARVFVILKQGICRNRLEYSQKHTMR